MLPNGRREKYDSFVSEFLSDSHSEGNCSSQAQPGQEYIVALVFSD